MNTTMELLEKEKGNTVFQILCQKCKVCVREISEKDLYIETQEIIIQEQSSKRIKEIVAQHFTKGTQHYNPSKCLEGLANEATLKNAKMKIMRESAEAEYDFPN